MSWTPLKPPKVIVKKVWIAVRGHVVRVCDMMRVFYALRFSTVASSLAATLAEVVIIEAKYAFVWTFVKRHESLLEVKSDGRDREKAFR